MKTEKWNETSHLQQHPENKAANPEYRRLELSACGRPLSAARALGIQLVIEMWDCSCERLDDLGWVKSVMIAAALRANATIVNTVFHKFNPIGISGVIVIAESHIAIHIWPEHRYAAVDVFSCGRMLKGMAAAEFLIEQFQSSRPVVMEMQRGVIRSDLGTRRSPGLIKAARLRRRKR